MSIADFTHLILGKTLFNTRKNSVNTLCNPCCIRLTETLKSLKSLKSLFQNTKSEYC